MLMFLTLNKASSSVWQNRSFTSPCISHSCSQPLAFLVFCSLRSDSQAFLRPRLHTDNTETCRQTGQFLEMLEVQWSLMHWWQKLWLQLNNTRSRKRSLHTGHDRTSNREAAMKTETQINLLLKLKIQKFSDWWERKQRAKFKDSLLYAHPRSFMRKEELD